MQGSVCSSIKEQTMDSVFVAGHKGMVGSAILRAIKRHLPKAKIITADRGELDLTKQKDVYEYVAAYKPGCIIMAAAEVGGILANSSRQADFITNNLMIQNNLFTASHAFAVNKVLFLGSSCIFPQGCVQPMDESYIMSGRLEPTNDSYSIAKIAGVKTCGAYKEQYESDFRCLMPCNLYGPNDNFSIEESHVLPALIRKFDHAVEMNAEQVVVWGTGDVFREFMHVDDLANACIFVLGLEKTIYWNNVDVRMPFLNVGSGADVQISELVELISQAAGFKGCVKFDHTMPNGMARKLLNSSKIHALGWKPLISLEEGVATTLAWYKLNKQQVRGF